ncbi:MAG: PrsW family intramembrane metalloprotease [Treponema sp.]|nr:PrsW family intramembrane metalloprotease [Treponema sp.]
MSGLGVLIFLLLFSSIPAIAVFVWFRLARYPFSPLRFSGALLAGAISFFPALVLQNVLAAASSGIAYALGKWSLIAEIFLRIAFTEEFSRLLALVILFFIISRLRPADPNTPSPVSALTMASAAGLIAGLGFAIIESAVYGASNPGNALLRTFTAAPLHGACGFRVGSSTAMFPHYPAQAVFRFLSAVVIHGLYNFMLIIPGLVPSIAAILIALSALTTSILAIRNGMHGE